MSIARPQLADRSIKPRYVVDSLIVVERARLADLGQDT